MTLNASEPCCSSNRPANGRTAVWSDARARPRSTDLPNLRKSSRNWSRPSLRTLAHCMQLRGCMPILTSHELVGTILDGKYRLERILGEGGFGVVYAARHVRLDRAVAVKLLHPHCAEDVQAVERFVREARATAALSHPNVVTVRDVDAAPDGSVYIVLELLEGESLAQHLARRGPLSSIETMSILAPILDALDAAHRMGIVHRDVKPGNVFLSHDASGRVVPKLLDFGVAKLAGATLTTTGTVLGTLAYTAPEQARGERRVGPWSDVWSVAVMLYECLTGRFHSTFLPSRLPPRSPWR